MSRAFPPWLVLAAALCGQVKSPFEPVPGAAVDRLVFQAMLPDFAGRDLLDRTWRLENLRGKLTVVDIWAVNCGPCRRVHPELQRFHERASRFQDVQVLSLSVDEDRELVIDYMAGRRYTFPVIVSEQLVERLFPSQLLPNGGIPQVWVVDDEGRRSAPFKAWNLNRVLIEVERVRGRR